MCSGSWEPRAATGLDPAADNACGGGIARNSSAARRSAEAQEGLRTREAAAHGSSALGKTRPPGGGPGSGGPVGSGRGLELGSRLDTRARGGAEEGVRTLGPPVSESRHPWGHGGNSPAATDSAAPKARVRCAGIGWGSRAGSGKGRPRICEAGRKWGLQFRATVLAGPWRRGSPQVAGAGRGFFRWWGRGAVDGRGPGGGGETPPPALSLPPALGAPRHYSVPATVAGRWFSSPLLPPARPPGLPRDGRPR